MSKPSKRGSKSEAGGEKRGKAAAQSMNADFLVTEERIQAVLLADSFTVKFRPLSLEQPKVLMPVLNVAMIDYVLEFVIAGGVQELIIFCCSHAKLIQTHINESKLLRRSSVSCNVRVIVSAECYSEGDALRHLDTLDLIKGDFVLISGDIVSNISLKSILNSHKQRVKQDKNTIMTVVLAEAAPGHKTRQYDDDTVIALNPETQQLLHYSNSFNDTSVAVPLTSFASNHTVDFHSNLMDTFIDICTPTVLLLCTDNFDYQSLRRDFIPGILGQEDILGHTVSCHITRDFYGARIGDLHQYDSISRDIMHRWTYPITPDANLIGNGTSYLYQRGNRYLESDVSIARDAVIGEDSVVGSGTTIGEETQCQGTVIGRNCTIGANVVLNGSFIWDNVTIEDGVTVDQAIIANGAIIRKGAHVNRGSVISYNVVIGADFVVKPYSKLTRVTQDDDVFEDDSDTDDQPRPEFNDPEAVGVGGEGHAFVDENTEDDDDDDAAYSNPAFNTIALDEQEWNKAWSNKLQTEREDESEDEFDFVDQLDEQDSVDAITDGIATGLNMPVDLLALPRFYGEAAATLHRGVTEQLPVDAIVLEMASLKLSHDASMLEYVEACILAFFSFVTIDSSSFPADTQIHRLSPEEQQTWLDERRAAFDHVSPSALKSLFTIMKKWSPVLSKFGQRTEEQIIFVAGLARACRRWNGVYAGVFGMMIKFLYDLDVVEEDAVFAWEDQFDSENDPLNEQLLTKAEPIINWLREAEEESDDEDESDED